MNKVPFGDGTILVIEKGGYQLKILPEVGGQVIGLEKDGFAALNEPQSFEAIKKNSTAYGLPVLFPPNRIDGGTFTAGGKTYHFPMNEAKRGNSLHGFLHQRPWRVERVEETEEKATVVLVFDGNETTDFFEYFPVKFEVRQTLELSAEGLKQVMAVTNLDTFDMPMGLGFHSAFAIVPGTKIHVSVGERILMSERMLPEGVRPLNEDEKKLRGEGLDPVAWNMDDHYTAEPIGDFHGAVIETPKTDGSTRVVTYEVDPFYRHWMIWNRGQSGDLVCIEPQNWRVNAPNLVKTLGEDSGMMVLEPMKTVEAYASLTIEKK